MDDELESYRRKTPAQTTKSVQQGRDLEALAILKAERNKPYNQNERASLEREIQRMSHSAGVAYDLGVPPKTPVIEPTPANLMQSNDALGSGRGAPGGPTAEQAAQQTFAPTTSASQKQIVPAALQGAAQGVTAGTFDYLPAGMAYAFSRVRDKLGSGRPDNYTFKELLAAQRANRQAVAKESPIAYTLGDIGGSVALGYATGGASIPVTMTSQGAQSAVRKYTESEDTTLADAAKAGAIGAGVTGVVGSAGRALGNAATKLKDSVLNKALTSQNEKSVKAAEKAVTAAKDAQAKSDAAYFKNLPESGPIPARPIIAPAATAPVRTFEQYAADQAAKPLTTIAGQKGGQLLRNVATGVTVPGIAGAGAYYVADQFPGLGVDPVVAGLAVAGGAPLATTAGRKLAVQGPARLKELGGLAVNKYPNVIPNTARAGEKVTGAVVNQIQGPTAKSNQDLTDNDLAELNQFRRQ